jgi:hypothetical protein
MTDIKLDWSYRVYTVLNFPPKTAKNIQTYGHMYVDIETQKFISDLNEQMKSIGLFELVAISKADQIGKDNILIAVEFSKINIRKFKRNKYIGIASLFLLGLLSLIIFI